MNVLLTDVQDRLISQVTDLKYVDEDWGQLDDYSPHFPVKWPVRWWIALAPILKIWAKKGSLDWP